MALYIYCSFLVGIIASLITDEVLHKEGLGVLRWEWWAMVLPLEALTVILYRVN